MDKLEFLALLRKELSGLPQDSIEECLTFYSEMIDDRIEDGLSEQDAVCEIGSVEEIVSQTVAEIPLGKLVKEKITPKKRLSVLEIVLLALGSPIWLSLLIAFFAVFLSLYISLWSVIISLWAVFVSVIGCAIGGIVSGILFIVFKNTISGIAIISTSLVCAGLSILLFFGCKAVTKGFLRLTKKSLSGIKNSFIKKEA